jgi:uroporphyrin-3 C-methyltransferase
MAEENTSKPDEVEETADEVVSGEEHVTADSGPGPDETSYSAEEAPRRGSLAGRLARVVVVIALVAGVGALLYWWQGRPTPDATTAEDIFVLQSLEDAQATLQRLQDQVRSLEGELGASLARVDSLNSDVEILPAELGALRRQVEALQGGRLDSRESWLREQAGYYLSLANTELRLGGRVGSAITALELADDVLRELGSPQFTDVRRAIAAELQSLRGVEIPDFERYLADLAGLIARVSELPMRSAVPQNFSAPDESLDDLEPGLGRLWERTKGAVTSIVRVERQDEPVEVLLTDAERSIVRRQLALELQIARTALFERRQEVFRASLVAADGILNRDFDRSAQSIIEARRLLAGMMRVEVEPELPRIGDSLTLLRTALGAE